MGGDFFQVGTVYKRSDIHAAFNGQAQGGISTPSNFPAIFLFTGTAGEKYGYVDRFLESGIFWYTGEGQRGDMAMARGNLAIKEHKDNGKRLYLYEYVSRGMVRFLGGAEYLGHHTEERVDATERFRKVFVFHLALIQDDGVMQATRMNDAPVLAEDSDSLKGMGLDQLRRLALQGIWGDGTLEGRIRDLKIRSKAIRFYALKRSEGLCEFCGSNAPFRTRMGPFLEVHHILRLSDGGPDHPVNVIALCPNCHRMAHYANESEEVNRKMQKKIRDVENH